MKRVFRAGNVVCTCIVNGNCSWDLETSFLSVFSNAESSNKSQVQVKLVNTLEDQ